MTHISYIRVRNSRSAYLAGLIIFACSVMSISPASAHADFAYEGDYQNVGYAYEPDYSGGGSVSEPTYLDTGFAFEPNYGGAGAIEPNYPDGSYAYEPNFGGNGSAYEPSYGNGFAYEPSYGNGFAYEPSYGNGYAYEPNFSGNGYAYEPRYGPNGFAYEPSYPSGYAYEPSYSRGYAYEPNYSTPGCTSCGGGTYYTQPCCTNYGTSYGGGSYYTVPVYTASCNCYTTTYRPTSLITGGIFTGNVVIPPDTYNPAPPSTPVYPSHPLSYVDSPTYGPTYGYNAPTYQPQIQTAPVYNTYQQPLLYQNAAYGGNVQTVQVTQAPVQTVSNPIYTAPTLGVSAIASNAPMVALSQVPYTGIDSDILFSAAIVLLILAILGGIAYFLGFFKKGMFGRILFGIY